MAWDRIAPTNSIGAVLTRVNLSIRVISLLSLACLIGSSSLEGQDVLTLPSAKAGAAYEYTIRSENGLPPLH